MRLVESGRFSLSVSFFCFHVFLRADRTSSHHTRYARAALRGRASDLHIRPRSVRAERRQRPLPPPRKSVVKSVERKGRGGRPPPQIWKPLPTAPLSTPRRYSSLSHRSGRKPAAYA